MREHFPAQHARAEGPQRNKDLRSKSLDFPSPAPSYIIAGQYANLACVYFYTVRPRGANEPGAFAPSRKREVVAMAQSKAEYPTPDCLAPAAIETKTEAAGVAKASLPVSKTFLLAMFAGAFIAFGGLFFTVFLSDASLGWGAQRFVGGLCFCLGLVLVLICGAELFTGNSLMVCALKSKKITLVQMLKAWVVVWIGNFAGALFVVFLVYMAAIYKLNGEAVANTMVSVAAGKVSMTPSPSSSAAFCATSLCAWLYGSVPPARPWSIKSWVFCCLSPPLCHAVLSTALPTCTFCPWVP